MLLAVLTVNLKGFPRGSKAGIFLSLEDPHLVLWTRERIGGAPCHLQTALVWGPWGVS